MKNINGNVSVGPPQPISYVKCIPTANQCLPVYSKVPHAAAFTCFYAPAAFLS